MKRSYVYKIIKEAFEDAGVMFRSDDNDIELMEYDIDSVQFIQAIVTIEDMLGIELPEQLLLLDRYPTLESFSESIYDFKTEMYDE